MNFDDQDWEQLGHPAGGDYRDPSTLWKVAAGVAAGMLLGAVLVYALDRTPAPEPSPAAAVWTPAEPPRAGAPSVEAAASGPGAPAAQPVDGAPPGAAEPAAETVTASAPAPMADAVARAAQLAAERRDRAWSRYYQKPAQCDDNPTKATMVECANHYIRARREFEQLYGPAGR